MAIQQADTQKNAKLDAIATTWGATPKLRIYSGTAPADETAALSGNTLLVEWTLTPQASAAGSKQYAGATLPIAATALAGGNASFYRVWNTGATVSYEQGTVTATGGGGDATIDNVVIALNQTVNLTGFSKSEPG